MTSVENYYDKKSNFHGTEIQMVRKYNNWIKSMLMIEGKNEIDKNGDLKGLDLACGKMGDLHKWNLLKIKDVWGVDVSRKSLRDAMRRYKALTRRNLTLRLFKSDLSTVRLFKSKIFKRQRFDMISSQFAMHYFWGNEESAKNIVHTISYLLNDGGVFVTTIPSSKILKKLHGKGNHWKSNNGKAEIKFKEDMDIDDTYGRGYTFSLDASVGGLLEYMIDRDNFIQLFKDEGMNLVRVSNFIHYPATQYSPQNLKREYRKRFNSDDISKDDKQIVGLYDIFIFKKEEVETNQEKILFYDKKDKETYFLSNFYSIPVEYDGKTYPSSEHAYQASKFEDDDYREEIRNANTPGISRLLGTQKVKGNYNWQEEVRKIIDSYPDVKVIKNWDLIKDDKMREIVYLKFSQNPELMNQLLSTGDALLIENSPRDDYWGIGKNRKGKNRLGEILMETREKLR
jgi:ribA/ribD-fused uncharacterized protein